MNSQFNQNQRKRSYDSRDSYNNQNYSNRPINDNWRSQMPGYTSGPTKNFDISADKKTAKFFIHPFSIHRNGTAKLENLTELGSVLSESEFQSKV